jgi:hypothetical protein
MRTSNRLLCRLACLTSTAAILAIVALGASPALGASTRPFLHAFGPQGFSGGAATGTFSNVQGVAVNQATGDVYVYDADPGEEGSIYQFNASGEPVDFSALGANVIEHVGKVENDEGELAVDSSSGPNSGDIYFASGESHEDKVLIYNSEGKNLAGATGDIAEESGVPWGEPCGVAVDSSGNVYVGLYPEHVNEYTLKSGQLTYVKSLFELSNICNIAVDSEGNVYTAEFGHNPVTKYLASQFSAAETQASGTEIDEHGEALATDPFTNEAFVDELTSIGEYSSTGTRLATFGEAGAGTLGKSFGVAVDHADDQVYASDETVVEIFGALEKFVGSQWSTSPATLVSATSATLNGTANPEGAPVTACGFEYGTTSSFGDTAACEQAEDEIGTGTSPVAVTAKVSGLETGTKYYFRIDGTGVKGVGYGSEQTFTTPVVPPTADIEPVTAQTANTATFNGEIDPNGSATTYRFEDSTDGTHWTPLGEASAGEGKAAVPVSQVAGGLVGSTIYHVRLAAKNAAGEEVTSSQTTFATTASQPQVFAPEATAITTTEATLYATIHPENQVTSYRFEYGPTTAYGTSAPVEEGRTGTSIQRVSVTLQSLQPATIYHYRLVASNGTGSPVATTDATFATASTQQTSGPCPNEQLRDESNVDAETGAPFSLQLPECRAYEQVTPEFKDGARIGTASGGLSLTGVETVAGSGESLTVLSGSLWGVPGGDGATSLNDTLYELARGNTGWTESSLTPQISVFPYAHQSSVSGLWEAARPSQPEHAAAIYLREADGTFVDVGPFAPPASTAGLPRGLVSRIPDEELLSISGASRDRSHVLFTLRTRAIQGEQEVLWPGDGTFVGHLPSLYEYFGFGHTGEGSDGPALVGVENNGAQISQCGTALASSGASPEQGVSDQGSTVFFTAAAGGCNDGNVGETGSGPVASAVYARIGSPGGVQATVNVAGSSGCEASASCAVTSPVTYQGASEDGSKVFFTTAQALLASDKDTTSDLYECELPGDSGTTPTPRGDVNACPNLKAITVTGTSAGAGVQSVVAISEDGSRVYFTATGMLTTTPNSQGRAAEVGKDNLYLWEAPTASVPAGRMAFVATLSGPKPAEAQSTPDGNFLVFTSPADLTVDDTSTVAQVFRYDAITGELARISVGRSGFNEDGNTSTSPAQLASRGATVSTDGEYVVFQSSDALTQTVHGGANNVYLWRQGTVSLISDGSDTNVNGGLLGMDQSGENIFFTTADRLVRQDTDESVDIYDARIDGGFPAPSTASCSGEPCQGTLSAPLSAISPLISSTGVPAVGNLAPLTKPKPAIVKPKPPTRAEKLAKALKQCRKDRSKSKRKRCEASAKAKYGTKAKRSKKSKKHSKK